MAQNTSPIFGLVANLTEVTFVNADGTTAKTIWTPDATDGGVLKHINVTSDDTATVTLDIFINDGTTDYLVGAVSVVTLSGTDGTNEAVDLMDPVMCPIFSEGALYLPGGYSVKVGPQAAVTAAKTVTIVGVGVDY